MRNPFRHTGPGALVAAAFIGPGTVTVCTMAGVQFGYGLLWALTLSIVATIVLQEMASRIGLVTGKGLSHVLRDSLPNGAARMMIITLVLAAIVLGNAAYEAGNLSGAGLGLQIFQESEPNPGSFQLNYPAILTGILALAILLMGNYKVLERIFIALVILMSISFVVTAMITRPDFFDIVKNLFVPRVPDQGILMVMALIGTTVVPYNLFLHAALVNQKWKGEKDLPYARRDTLFAVIAGGIVSMSILIAASGIKSHTITNVSEMAEGLAPLYGSLAKYTMAVGMFAAGLTSSITAPLSAAYVAQGCLGFGDDQNSWRFRSVWITILFLGIILSSLGIKPVEVIQFAQVANGLLLPVIAGILIWLANQKRILALRTNSLWHNILSFVILGITMILGGMSILKAFS